MMAMSSQRNGRRRRRCVVYDSLVVLIYCSSLIRQGCFVAAGRTKSNFYKTLGVSKSCSEAELKKAYRKKCLKHHPDKGGDEDIFKEIQKAYNCLSDADQRRQYDQFGEAGLKNGNAAGNPFAGAFHSGGGGSSSSSSSVPPNVKMFGGNPFGFGGNGGGGLGGLGGMNMDSILRDIMSQQLGGGGGGGFGFPPQQQQQRRKRPMQIYSRPLPCTLEDLYTGTTKRLKVNFGSGTKAKIFNLKVKPGWKQGTKVKYPPSASYPGITFVVEETPHRTFRRDGNDLIYRHKLKKRKSSDPVVTIQFTLPDGMPWKRTLPATSSFLKPGRTLAIPDKGMPIKGGPERGTLLLEFY